jgi:hypothetical protein
MNAMINWYKNLDRNTQIVIAVAVCFTPIVGIVLNIVFGIVGIIFNLINWKGVLFFVIVGIVFAAKALYTWVDSDDDDDTDIEDNPFTW